jgi:predicted nucleic acid-binding protein
MKVVFADTFYWVAVVNPWDRGHGRVLEMKASLGQVKIVTTDEILVEFLASLSDRGEVLRKGAAQMVRAILSSPNVRVIQQSRDSFLKGLDLYEARPDKEYSLTDCVSMNLMEREGIREALTEDHHFTQEGFNILFKKESY